MAKNKKKESNVVPLQVRFWGNDLEVKAPTLSPQGTPIKKSCWDSGMICMAGRKDKPFQCLEDIIPIMREHMREQHIVMVSSHRRPRAYSHKRKDI